ncbi:MAG: EAL domain-containing protein [Gammaproteobacteria bacterium]
MTGREDRGEAGVHPAGMTPAEEAQSQDTEAGIERPSIIDLQDAATAFTAAFNTALYELETTRKQNEERSAKIGELDEAIKSIRAALDAEVSKGRMREEEYSREAEQLGQKIIELESERDRLQEKAREQESISIARADELARLSSRIEAQNGVLEQHAAEALCARQEFEQERDRLEGALNALQAQYDKARDESNELQAMLEDRNSEIAGLRSQLDERAGELQSKTSEISGLGQQLSGLREELESQSEVMHRQAEQHAHASEELNTRIADFGAELQMLRVAHDELAAHAEKLEALNTALHESSISKRAIQKNQQEEIELLRSRLEKVNTSLNIQSDETLEAGNQARASNDLEEELKAAQARIQTLDSEARLASELESENERLRGALQAATESACLGEEDAQRQKALQEQLADLQSMLDSSRTEQKILAEQLHDHEQLRQEVASLREVVRQAEDKQDEPDNCEGTSEASTAETGKAGSATSASGQGSGQHEPALSGAAGAGLSLSPAEGGRQRNSVDGVSDRARFIADLDILLADNRDSGSSSSHNLMYILLDKFIQVRDEIGVMESEHVIKDVAEIIASFCSGDDVVSRFGDCTFAMICSGESLAQTEEKAEKIRLAIESRIFEYDGRSVLMTLSIGICSVRKSDSGAGDVIARADLACEAARSYGGNHVLVSSAMADNIISTGAGDNHEAMVRAILDEHRARIYYQPITSLKGEQGNQYEILIRIIDGSGSVILPGEFISMASKCGLAAAVDRYIIENVMKMMADNRGQSMTLFIKLTGQSVADQEFPVWMMHKIKEYAINPAQLVFEVAENLLQSDIKNFSMLSKAINAVGCKIAIEHYRMSCQLQHLKHIHAYYLKIDSGLIESIRGKGASLLKVAAIMKMARENNYITIAEGVESSAALAILCELGVDMAQGYFIQEPAGNRDFNFQIQEATEEQDESNKAKFRIG